MSLGPLLLPAALQPLYISVTEARLVPLSCCILAGPSLL